MILRRAALGGLTPLALGLPAVACTSTEVDPPQGQLLVFLDTDAPVVSGSGQPGTTREPIALFDRLRVDVTSEDGKGCANCSREFDVTAGAFAATSVSFGVLGAFARGTIRARLFRSHGTLTGAPNPDSTIDVAVAVPAIAQTGVVSMTLLLPTEETGQGQTRRSLTAGAPSPSKQGTWPGAARHPCPTAPQAGEVCVPGGAYWMGNPHAAFAGENDGDRQRIAVMSPFYIDATEVTVAAFRASGIALDYPWTGVHTGASQDYCTFTAAPGPYDAYPVNCVPWYEARQYCQSLGKDLPTEAQYEYAASDLDGQLYPWGSDVPGCADAVVARAGVGSYAEFYGQCRTTPWGGVEAPGSGARDRVVLPTGTLFDLAGNLGEPCLDRWAPLTDACWSRPGIYHDPLCGPVTACPTAYDPIVERGGVWAGSPFSSTVALRFSQDCGQADPLHGVRCVRRAK